MNRIRVAAVVALCLAGALAAPASARLRAAELAGDTTITATGSGSVTVAVPDDATLSWKMIDNPDISISGGGRLVGFLLDPVRQSAGAANSVMVMRLPSSAHGALEVWGLDAPASASGCTQPGEDPAHPLGDCSGYRDPGFGILYEGLYRLTVLTDGSPVTIRLTLHGLEGQVDVTPTAQVASVEASMTEREGVPGHAVSAGTDAVQLAKDGFSIAYGMVRTAAGSRVRGGESCEVPGELAAAPGVYGPGCDGQLPGTIVDPLQQLPAGWGDASLSWGDESAGSHGRGLNAHADSGVSFVEGVVAFLPGT